MTDQNHSTRSKKKNSDVKLNWVLTMGVLSTIAGAGALIFAGITSLVAITALGWFYIVAGIASIVIAFKMKSFGGFWSSFAIGALFLFGGASVVTRPVLNLGLLTLIIGVMMGVTGVKKIVGSFAEKSENKGMLLVSGLLSVTCCGIVTGSWQFSGAWVIGIFAGIDLIFWGVVIIRYASAAHHALS